MYKKMFKYMINLEQLPSFVFHVLSYLQDFVYITGWVVDVTMLSSFIHQCILAKETSRYKKTSWS